MTKKLTDQEKRLVTEHELVNPKIYHIHIDTQSENESTTLFHDWVRNTLGFFAHDFTGHPDGYAHFEPTMHSSIKIKTREEFNNCWKQLEEKFSQNPDIKGYLEGEFIPTDFVIPYKKLELFKEPCFKIERRTLLESRNETFRQTEFHLCLDNNNSDSRVVKALLDAGLYGALLKKPEYEMIVLTMQGDFRMINILKSEVRNYLKNVGGVVRATMKEEVALKNFRMNMTVAELPEIAHKIIIWD